MEERQTISIIIPTYNEADNIVKLLRFINTHKSTDVIETIVVNASKTTDNTAELAIECGAKVITCDICTRSAQLNHGALAATGNILYFIHADVLPPQRFGTAIMKAINDDIDYGFFSYKFDSDSMLLKINSYFTKYNGVFAGGGDQTLFITKSCFTDLGGFDESDLIMEDFNLYRKAKSKDVNITIINDDALVSARKYQDNSYLRVNLVNLATVIMWQLGYSQEKLKKFYNNQLK